MDALQTMILFCILETKYEHRENFEQTFASDHWASYHIIQQTEENCLHRLPSSILHASAPSVTSQIDTYFFIGQTKYL
jgi:hypothetical protein